MTMSLASRKFTFRIWMSTSCLGGVMLRRLLLRGTRRLRTAEPQSQRADCRARPRCALHGTLQRIRSTRTAIDGRGGAAERCFTSVAYASRISV